MNKPTRKKNPAAVALGKISTPKKAASSRANAVLATQARKKLAATFHEAGRVAVDALTKLGRKTTIHPMGWGGVITGYNEDGTVKRKDAK